LLYAATSNKKAKQQELLRRALGTTNAKWMRPKGAIRFE
jgi:hypothetical protein